MITPIRNMFVAGSIIFLSWFGDPGCAEQPASQALPTFDQIQHAVVKRLAETVDFKANDLISQTEVRAVLADLDALGWQVPAGEKLIDRALANSHFLIKQFGTRKGKEFIRKAAQSKGGYVRLDRLSESPDGKKHLRYLIGQKDGHLLIDYMATTSGGRQLGRQVGQIRGATNLNKATGRIYTAKNLLTELQTRYAGQATRKP